VSLVYLYEVTSLWLVVRVAERSVDDDGDNTTNSDVVIRELNTFQLGNDSQYIRHTASLGRIARTRRDEARQRVQLRSALKRHFSHSQYWPSTEKTFIHLRMSCSSTDLYIFQTKCYIIPTGWYVVVTMSKLIKPLSCAFYSLWYLKNATTSFFKCCVKTLKACNRCCTVYMSSKAQ